MFGSRSSTVALIAVAVMAISTAAGGADWPTIPAAERQLTSVSGVPNAPAVVLSEVGRLVLNAESRSSHQEVYRRIKILNEEGKGHGSVSVFSSEYFRMKNLEARTHLPDGSIVDLPENAVFEKRFSQYYERSLYSFAMPEVKVGSIVEYRYRIYFDHVYFTKPWYYQSDLPVLHSELQCVVPKQYTFHPFVVQTLANKEVEHHIERNAWGLTAFFEMNDMPPVPDEPYRFPFAGLACRATMLPQSLWLGGAPIPLLESWRSAVRLIQGNERWGYEHFRDAPGSAKSEARKLVAGLSTAREKATRVYAFVRDEIATAPFYGISSGEQTGRAVLKDRRGTFVEKALLLQVMLKAVKIKSSIGWTSPANWERINTEMPNLGQFSVAMVVAELDGGLVFLQPWDRTLAFGALQPSLEAVPCLLVDRRKPEWVLTSTSGPEASRRLAKIKLHLDQEGRLIGSGSLALTGHSAWLRLGWRDTSEETQSAWHERIEHGYPGFDIADLEVTESIESREVDVTWTLKQRDEDVLGDQASIAVAGILARTSNPFSAPSRLTPVYYPFPRSETVELELSWAAGWQVDAQPGPASLANAAGRLSAEVTSDEDQGKLQVVREFVLQKREFANNDAYQTLRSLFEAVAKYDSEAMVLMRMRTQP